MTETTEKQSLPDLTVLKGKSFYFTQPDLRRMEINVDSQIPIEGSYAYLLKKLKNSLERPQDSKIEEKTALLLEIVQELMMQNPSLVDFRGHSDVKNEHQKAFWSWRQETYERAIREDWTKICVRYEETKEFYIDLGDYKLYPVALTERGEIDQRFSTKPTINPGICKSFDAKEAEECKKWQQEVAEGNPNSRISVGSIRWVNWDTPIYSRNVEELYTGFKGLIDAKLEAFEKTHGSLTPFMVIPANDVKYQVLSDVIMLGYRVEFGSEAIKNMPKLSIRQKIKNAFQ